MLIRYQFLKSIICASVSNIYGRNRATLFLVLFFFFAATRTFIKVPWHFFLFTIELLSGLSERELFGAGKGED